jgi:NAD(P)-dependent dehydrogenase (short-subunit alcohol dehydrogenase family)
MDNGLTGKVALGTGGTRKLGRAITRRLAEAGTDVAISDTLRDEGED